MGQSKLRNFFKKAFQAKNFRRGAFLLALVLVSAEIFYFASVYGNLPETIPTANLILIYSGGEGRTQIIQQWKDPKRAPLFLLSGYDFSKDDLETKYHLDGRLIIEDRAKTTDQNARYSAPLLRQARVEKVVLALPWYHLPRALFLTRFYLWGSGISVEPFATIPLPRHWIFNFVFEGELVKFWGSLGRVALTWVGIGN